MYELEFRTKSAKSRLIYVVTGVVGILNISEKSFFFKYLIYLINFKAQLARLFKMGFQDFSIVKLVYAALKNDSEM